MKNPRGKQGRAKTSRETAVAKACQPGCAGYKFQSAMPHKPAIDIEKLKASDEDEWGKAWKPLYRAGRNVARGYKDSLGSDERDDFIIQAVTKAHQRIQKFKSFDHLCKFVATTTKNGIRDELKRRKTAKRGGGQVQSLEALRRKFGADTDAPGPGDDRTRCDIADQRRMVPDEAAHLLILADMLENAFKRIDVRYGNVVWDFYIERFTQKEIAKKRGLRLGSVGVYLKRGLDEMREFMPERDKTLWWEKQQPVTPWRKKSAKSN